MIDPEPEVLLEAPAPPPADPGPTLPWEDPGQPRLAALLTTIWELLRHPSQSFRAPGGEGWDLPLGFGLITGTFGLLAASHFQLLFSLGLNESLARVQGLGGSAFGGGRGLLALMFFTPVLVLLGLFLGSLCLLMILRLWRRPASLSAAFRISCYAQAGLVLAVFPLLGALAGASVSLYLKVKGVQEVFSLPGWRAWIAVFLALLLEAFLLLMGLLALILPLLLSRLS